MCEYEVLDQLGVRDFSREFGAYLRSRFGWSISAGPLSAVQQEFGDRAWDALFDLISDFRASLLAGST